MDTIFTTPNLELKYTVDKHPNAYGISVPPSSQIAQLKSAIRAHPLRGVLPQDLVLWKLTTQIHLSPHETVGERVKAMNLDEIAVELTNDDETLSEAFPDAAERELHFIVHVGRPSSPPIKTWTFVDSEPIDPAFIENPQQADKDALHPSPPPLNSWTFLDTEPIHPASTENPQHADKNAPHFTVETPSPPPINPPKTQASLDNQAAKRSPSAVAARIWESEKRELLKLRDEALAHSKSTDNMVKELLSEDVKHACQLKDYQAQISELQSARDKDSLRYAAFEEDKRKASSDAFDAARAWESEKRELLKSRDEALVHAKTTDNKVKELLSEDAKHACQLKDYQTQISELQSARDKDSLRHAAVEEEEKRELLKSRDEALTIVKELLSEGTKHAGQLKECQIQISELQSARDNDSLRLAVVEEAERKASSAASDAARIWEEEKRELLKSRDEALVHAKSTDNMVKKLVIENTKHACQLKDYQAQISELQSARDKDSLRHAAFEEDKRKASSAASDAARTWEEEKRGLLKSRDEALVHAKSTDNMVKKLVIENTKHACQLKDYQAQISELRSARDKDSLRHAALFVAAVEEGKSEASSAASAAARSWEEDKLRLERARVEALARADTADKLVKKPLSDDVKDISKLNERRIKMLELQSARARDTAAAKNASPPSPTTEELSKRHAQELKTLHIQLTALCKASLKAAANAAILFTKEEAAVAATSGKSTQADTRTAISIKSHDAEPRARHAGTAMMSTRFAAARGLPPMGPASSAAATVATKVEAAANVVSHGVPTSRVSPPGAVMVRGSTRGATPGRGDATPHAQGATPAVSIIDAASKQSREDVLVVEQVKRVKPAADLKATTASTRRVAFRPRSPDM